MSENAVGRPPKLEADPRTLKLLTGLGSIFCTKKEAAAALSVSEPTFHKFLNDHPEAREAFEIGEGQAKASLRRKQFKLADKNAAMAIFLGKNYLGQKDKVALVGGDPEDAPIQHAYDLTGLTDEDIAALVRIKQRVPAPAQDPDLGPDGRADQEG